MISPPPWKPIQIPANLLDRGIYLGTSGFEFQDWQGRFYPPSNGVRQARNVSTDSKIPTQDWFKFYQQYFSFLEIGHTFYQEPQLQAFLEFERRSKASMRFSVKVHGDISHKGIWDLEQGKALMKKHVEAVSPLSDTGKFYSFLIQLDHTLERKRKVHDFLISTASVAIGEGLDVHIEFRNRTWHQESVLQSLKDYGIGICNTEIPGLSAAFPLKTYATSKKGYTRYHGLNRNAWESAEGGVNLSPTERQNIIQSRSDYLYSQKELEARLVGQVALKRKVDLTAIVFTNHIQAQAVLNAIQVISLLTDKLD
jgi:uncharacterized protein YecE (DUF72 family)